ncbi:MAG: glycosyltransferase [Hydrogenophilales bacterium]|nr:glycosyltransferase [Hydrogenophilales bacterium]
MSEVRLSAALIVRDEERFLEGCLKSLSGRVDEVVVVDTGSTDRSKQIARDLGARLFDYAWQNDFASARNHAIDQTQGTWILYIDADERLTEFDGATVGTLLNDPGHICYSVGFRPAVGFSRYREYRLFRKHPDLRFRGSVHESVVPALEELCATGHWHIGHSPVAIDHLGYEGDLRHKHERNLPLLRARLERDPWHIYSWDQLGLTLLGLDDAVGAEATWRHAIEIIRALPRTSDVESLPYQHLAGLLLDQKRDASALLDEGCRRFPNNHSLTWLHARHLVETGQYAAAKPIFARLTEIDPERLDTGKLAFDTAIFGAQAHAALGLCAFHMAEFAESAVHYARAAALAPDDLEIRAKQAFAALRARSRPVP